MRIAVAIFALLIAVQAFAGVTCPSDFNKVNPTGVLGEDASGYLSGCLTESQGLVDNPGTPSWDNAYIAWNITPLTSHPGYRYEYTWSATSKAVSHVILGLSQNCTAASGCIWNIEAPAGTTTSFGNWGSGPGNPGFPAGASFWGIKFDGASGTTYSFSFESDRVPVWQNFYAKDGKDGGADVYAYNAGLGISGENSYYVVAPDTIATPEPGFYGLLSLGLAGLYLAIRRRQTAK